MKPAIEPSRVRFRPGQQCLPMFDPTIDAIESPIPTLRTPLNCAKCCAKLGKKHSCVDAQTKENRSNSYSCQLSKQDRKDQGLKINETSSQDQHLYHFDRFSMHL